jgi:hypothetical protein
MGARGTNVAARSRSIHFRASAAASVEKASASSAAANSLGEHLVAGLAAQDAGALVVGMTLTLAPPHARPQQPSVHRGVLPLIFPTTHSPSKLAIVRSSLLQTHDVWAGRR